MSLNSLIDARYKAPSTTTRFNGNRARDILSIAVNQQLDGGINTAAIRTANNPNINPETKVTIQQGYNGSEQLTFTGYVDTIERNENDGSFTISSRDVLKKALDTFLVQEVKFGQDIAAGQYYYSTYTSTDGGTFTIHQYGSISALNAAHPETTGNYSSQGVKAEAVVQWLLHMSGLAEGSEIQVDTTNFWIGDINPAKFHLTSVYDAAMQIANLIGWRIYADAAGVARFKKRPRQPGGYTYWSYTDKAEPYNILRLTKTSSNVDLRNYVEIRGASGIRSVRRAASPFIGNTPYRGVLISEELIDTQGIADFMATRILQDLNRLKVSATLEADGNPLLVPGSTLNITSAATTGKYLAETIQTNMSADGGYKMTVGCAAYLGDTVFQEDPTVDIVADFVPTFVSVLGDPKWVVDFDGASSYSSRGVITTWNWTWPDSTTLTSSGSTATFIFDQAAIIGGNSQNVTLQVTDSVGNTASVTKPITTSGLTGYVSPKYRALYGALTTIAVGSIDGGQTWFTNSIPAISVAASNFGPGGIYVSSGHALFGTSDGKIYKTVDTCVTMTLVDSPGGQVTDIHIPELDSTKAVAVTSTGKVLYSDTSGDTWSQIGSFSFALREAKMGYTNQREVTIVGSGVNHTYITEDLGGNWASLGINADVLWATDGSQTNYFATTAGVLGFGPGGATTLTFSGGGSPAVPAATVMIDRDDGVMIVDANGQHWVASAGVFGATQNNSANKTKHMIRDGEMALVGYYATASGISKSLDRNATIQSLYYPTGTVPTGGWGRKVAYGPMAALFVPTQLVFRGITVDVATNPGGTPTAGFHLATTSGWLYQCENRTGLTAITTGGIAIAEDGPNSTTNGYIHLVKCIGASGVGSVAIGQLVFNANWEAMNGRTMRAFTFNRRSDTRGTLCTIYENDAVPLNSYVNARSYPDFMSTANGPYTDEPIVPPTVIRDIRSQQTTSVLGELVFTWNDTNFSPDLNNSIVYNSDGSITVNAPVSFENMVWANYQKSSPEYRAIVYYGGDIQLLTGWTGSTFSLESTNIPNDTGINTIFGSYIDQSRIYYLDSDGIYAVDAYGQGTPVRIFDPVTMQAGSGMVDFRVTANKDTTEDYLTAIFSNTPDYGVYNTRGTAYSLDSGATWIRGPNLVGSVGTDLWVVDPL